MNLNKIFFEVSNDAPLYDEGNDKQTSLHEALCQAIHEQNPEALQWLTDNVVNIQ